MRSRLFSVLLPGLLFLETAAHALIVHGDPGPMPDPAAYVGSFSDASGVYLGDLHGDGSHWVITANHVTKAGTFTIGGYTYDVLDGKQVAPGLDLYVFRIDVPVDSPILSLSPMVLASTTALNGTPLVMVGNGGSNQSGLTTWNAAWEAGELPTAYTGYTYTVNGRTFTWGSGESQAVTSEGYNYVVSYFEQEAGSAAGVVGDSGGGMFVNVGGEWQLAAVMVSNGRYEGQPGNVAVFGNLTAGLNVATYRDLILAAIPEPSFGGVAGVAVLLGVLRRKRRA